MQHVDLGGIRASAIGLGTWQFGSREWGYGSTYATETAPALVRRAAELGVTFVDTAEIYGFGESERIVGRALRELGERRPAMIAATKLMPVLPIPPYTVSRALASRRRLDVTTIDLYQVHWPNPLVPLGTTMAGFRRLLHEGVVRAVGVSNHSLGRWRAAERALGSPIVSNQVRFSLASPAPLRELVPYARETGRVVIAYSPLAQGLLLRDPADGARPADRSYARRMGPLVGRRAMAAAEPLRRALAEVAEAHGASRAQVALAWVIGHGNVIAIPGARTLEQLEQNAAAADLTLTPDQRDRLTAEALAFAARRS